MPRREQEDETLRRQNRWYIDDAPEVIQFVPHPVETSEAGGSIRRSATPRPPQRVRFIALDRQRTSKSSLEQFGSVQREVDFEVVGDIDLEVEVGDTFTFLGDDYVVSEISPTTSSPYLRRVQVYGLAGDV